MLKIIKLFKTLILKVFWINNNKIVKINDKVDKIFRTLFKFKKLKNKKIKILIYTNIKVIKKPIFLIFITKKVFNYLKQVYIKALIF